MSKESLKTWRLLVPGILIFFVFYPLYRGFSLSVYSEFKTDDVVFGAIVVLLGALYRILNFRSFFFYQALGDVHRNIKSKLLTPFALDPNLTTLQDLPPHEFMDVFYKLVDRDPTLTEKSKDVYENGLLLSSFADIATISAMGMAIYLGVYLATSNNDYATFVLVLEAALFIGIALVIVLANRHIKLGDAQLRIIERFHSKEAHALLLQLATVKK